VIDIKRLFTSLLVVLMPGLLLADISPETRWADPSSVQLEIEFPGQGYHARWELVRCDCGDLLVNAWLEVPDESVYGDILLVENRAVLTRGFGKYGDQAAASLDAAALMMQLALRLLERSEPGGPSKITGPKEVDLLDEINHINLDTGSAAGGFQAPWSVAGKISAPAETQRKFDLNFSFTVGVPGEVQQASMRLYGIADFADVDFPIDGDSSLDDWKLDWRNEGDEVPGQANTLDELRALIKGN
jgi:hypothetical protein